MSALETLKEAASQVASTATEAASNPKLTAVISTSTAGLSAAAATDLVNGLLVTAGMIAGLVVTCLLGLVHFAKYRILRRQLKDLEDGKQIGSIE